MQFFFAISVLCLGAFLLATISIARHIRAVNRSKFESRTEVPPSLAEVPVANPPVEGKKAAQRDRLDWAYFNQDLGDLSDPYQSRASSSGVRPALKSKHS